MNRTLIFVVLSLICRTVTAQVTDDISRINLFTIGGLPVHANEQIKTLINWSYITGYDERLKNPLWVAFRLGNIKGTTASQNWERPYSFVADRRTKSMIDHEAYTGSGYDRGHMAPNATMLQQYGQLGQIETFLMSNICPQKPNLNQKIWADLEELERTVLSQDDTKNKEVHDLFVITGPIFSTTPDTLPSGVAIPTSFYRILAFKKGYLSTLKAVSFIIPQNPPTQELSNYYTTIDWIEELTGLNFFPELTNVIQRNLESKKRDTTLLEVR